MKKFFALALIGFITLMGFTMQAKADDTLIELYPYDQENCLLPTGTCTGTRVLDSFWTLTYNGNRYHVVKGGVRYTSDWDDDNADGFYSALEITGISYSAFAALTINNTDEEFVVSTANARTDLTANVVHRKYAYFDELGVLQMFEDHIGLYWIFNDLDGSGTDWRLATQAEIDAYNAAPAESKPTSTMQSEIRMALDSTDADGYVIEPLGYLTWSMEGVDTLTAPVEDWSVIIDGNPNYVTIPAGWTVISFGTYDRSTYTKPMAFITGLPVAMVDETLDPMVLEYTDQPAAFTGLTAHDDDLVTAGINVVVDYNGTYDLPNDVVASWVNMFDVDGNVINEVEKLDYSVTISQEGVDLETINFVYDSGTDAYIPSGAVSVIDSSVFGSGYLATYHVVTPEMDVTEVMVDIVIGVMPPVFVGVANRYAVEAMPIDLLEGVTANDGYGNDKTDSIIVTAPEGFNIYNPKPGVYDIDLTFTHHVHYDGIDPTFVLDGTSFTFNGATNLVSTNWAAQIIYYDDVTALQATTFSWGSAGMIIEVDGSGNVIRTINRRTWDLVDVNGLNTPANASGMFDAWKAGLVLEPNGFVLLIGVSTGTAYTTAQALVYGDPVSVDLTQVPVFDYDIITDASYVLTIDDVTAPQIMAVNAHYQIRVGEFTNVNTAILSNCAAFDLNDPVEDLAMYVSDNGGLSLTTVGTYTVEVTVEDVAGNSAVTTFDVIVAPAYLTAADVQAMLDAQTITAAEVQALLDAQLITTEDIQAMLDAQTLTAEEIQALLDAQIITTEDIQAMLDAQTLTAEEIQALIDVATEPAPDTGCAAQNASIVLIGMLGMLAFFVIRKK